MIKFWGYKATALLGLLLAVLTHSMAAQATTVDKVRVWPDKERTRVVLDLSASPSYGAFRLSDPERLVVDLRWSTLKTKLSTVKADSKQLKRIRVSTPPEKGTLRLVLDLKQASSYKVFKLGPKGNYGHRLVIDLLAGAAPSAKAKPRPASKPGPGRNVVIAIDAGHGGKDPGSIGPSGTYEKNVVLPIARKLRDQFNKTPGFEAFMVRSGDYFVSLNRRSELAREKKADLLLSIHADAFTSPQPQGASVWILSKRRANSEMGRWLEKDDKLSELRGIGEVISASGNDDPHLQRTFLDLARENSMVESQAIAEKMLRRLGRIAKLHKKTPQHASLAVLKSPDFPSLLIETGFISNPKEEKKLRSSSYQNKMSDAIYQTVKTYFSDNPPRDALLAQTRQHTVSRGESLSRIAQRYRVSVSAIRQANRLKTDTLQVGQKLTIPRL
ncbi:N-acetylmuramoyl-L-alanine amidase [Ferrimonas sediminum]|uniref:N-acetylmuramoyl-L-alanine amidase n=1 Tax=Ferrimonas sediminum TaxID=718193 RepID=A0A1G8MLG6_9GAMM|nr:N-acetylmuramoyl-L-alanine amidase [Ferrimonas sediminum]SDI68831.1 N-acetylmuramoyl-L-alanine amidase [Ferrimonas sediminum]